MNAYFLKKRLSVGTKLFMASAFTRFLLALMILILLWVLVIWSLTLV